MRRTTRCRWLGGVLALAVAAGCGPRAEAESGAETEGTGGTSVRLPALFTIMAGLEQRMAGVSRGVWLADADTIAENARAIADHPAIPPGEVERISGVLGPDMTRFKELDTEVHDLAVRIEHLAREDEADLRRVLKADAELRRGCVDCHAEFRERLRETVR